MSAAQDITLHDAAIALHGVVQRYWEDDEASGPSPIHSDRPDAFWLAANTLQTRLDAWDATATAPDPQVVTDALDFFHRTVPRDASHERLAGLTATGLASRSAWLDDYGWWGIALLMAGAVEPDEAERAGLVHDADNCWRIMHGGWAGRDADDGPIPGGVWNCNRPGIPLSGRNSVTNEQFWLLSLRLAAATGDDRYLDPATDILAWWEQGLDRGLVLSPSGLVAERPRESRGWEDVRGFQWAGDQGLLLACLDEETRDLSPAMRELAASLPARVATTMTDDGRVLHDRLFPMQEFHTDYATGKGVLLRMLPASARPPGSPAAEMVAASARQVVAVSSPDSESWRVPFSWDPAWPAGSDQSEWDSAGMDGHGLAPMAWQCSGLSAVCAAVRLAADESA